MYLRFEIDKIDEDSGRNMGIFMAMEELQYDDMLYDYEKELADEIYKWFGRNLRVPTVQSSESNKYKKSGAISWFKSTAITHISKMRLYCSILEAHDVSVNQIITERPGNIVYEDKYQVAAIPFKDTFNP